VELWLIGLPRRLTALAGFVVSLTLDTVSRRVARVTPSPWLAVGSGVEGGRRLNKWARRYTVRYIYGIRNDQ